MTQHCSGDSEGNATVAEDLSGNNFDLRYVTPAARRIAGRCEAGRAGAPRLRREQRGL